MKSVSGAGRGAVSSLGGGGSAPAASGSASVSTVIRCAIFSVGRCSSSLTSVTMIGVSAAAIGVPLIQNCDVINAAAAEAILAMTSVRTFKRRSSCIATRLAIAGGVADLREWHCRRPGNVA